MSTTRSGTARHVRQRKLNLKQGLRIIRESEVEDQADDGSQQHVQQIETGVEKAEEVEYHLQAVINAANAAALGAKAKLTYIPTPEVVRAKGVKYDELYPKTWKEPATYIRFSSTVEDSTGTPYCMNDDDVEFLAKLNDGKDVDGRDRKDKLSQCSEDTFEEVMSFFEETSARLQPYANVDNAPILSLEEMEQSMEEPISAEAHKWLKPVYQYWVLRKGNRPLMAAIKVRVLDTASEADDADPYVCFRRREVRQTRKTRGRDAQVTEKLKKLRLELESARQLIMNVVQRENLKADDLTTSRRVFEERKKLKEVKVAKGIVGDKGDDEELLVNQKPITRPGKSRTTGDGSQRPPTLKLRPSMGDRAVAGAPDTDLPLFEEWRDSSDLFVQQTIDARKEQHKKWNQHWVDNTKYPLTPPTEDPDPLLKWMLFPPADNVDGYPTPPPSMPSARSSVDQEKTSQPNDSQDVEMADAVDVKPPVRAEEQATTGADDPDELPSIFHIPGAYPLSDAENIDPYEERKRNAQSMCRLRYGRGGRCYLESRKRRPYGQLGRGVVSDSDDSDDEDAGPEYFPVSERITFEYRTALNNRPTRPEGVAAAQQQAQAQAHHQRHFSDQGAVAGAHGHPSGMQQ